ncbi:MAG: hypothetical protein ACOVLE_16820, partial [Pirellula staleyi]
MGRAINVDDWQGTLLGRKENKKEVVPTQLVNSQAPIENPWEGEATALNIFPMSNHRKSMGERGSCRAYD